MKYIGIRESFPAREERRKPRKLTEKEKKESGENLLKLRKRVIMNWAPKKCRERIEMLKNSWEDTAEAEIAMIREHLRSIGKD